MKLCELMSKRVVCVNEGRELGFISDAILSVSLQIQFIIVTQPKEEWPVSVHGCLSQKVRRSALRKLSTSVLMSYL